MKQVITNYSFSTSGKTITLSDFGAPHPVDLKRLYLITDVTTNKILYNFADATVASATISSNNVITLSALQGGEANGDALQIIYDVVIGDPTYELPQTELTDGTNTANVVAGDSGFSGVATAAATKTYTFTTSTSGVQNIGPYNCEGYRWMEIIYTSVGSGLALGGQFAPTSGGTYVSSSTFGAGPGAFSSPLGVASGTFYSGPVKGNYFQIAVSALTSGTFTGTITLSSVPPPLGTINAFQAGTYSVGSSSATGSGVPANAFYTAINSGGTLTGWASVANAGDGLTGGSIGAIGPLVYNGSSWDRTREANAAAGTTGTGLLGAGAMGYDGTDWRALSTSSTGVLSVSSAPTTSGGLSAASGSIGATATSIKASAGQVYGYTFYNNNSAIAYVQFFNTASGSVTLGTTAPVYSIGLPANSGANVSFQQGVAHSSAITIGITTTRAGSTSPSNTVDYNIFYT